jgi:AcrR family transcriptional regulator
MPEAVKKRTYDSAERRARAEGTRERILDAAATRFVEVGYARASTAGIARLARTSEASLFAYFGSKANLLVAVVRDRVTRHPDFPLRGQPIWRAFAARRDTRAALQHAARVVRGAHERSWRLLAVATAAAENDAALAELQREGAEGRRTDVGWLIREVVGLTGAAADRATDSAWTLGSVENYRHLVVDLGWSAEAYERWLAEMLEAAVGAAP